MLSVPVSDSDVKQHALLFLALFASSAAAFVVLPFQKRILLSHALFYVSVFPRELTEKHVVK